MRKNQNAEINDMDIYCIFAQVIFSEIWIEAASSPENKDQLAMANIIKVK
jgi:hypothetical protein